MTISVSAVAIPQQKILSGVAFPLVLQCQTPDATLADATAWIADHRDQLEEQLQQHTVILFRAFPLSTAVHFDAFIAAFEYDNFRYEESLSNAVRVSRTERVFTANEAPPTFTIELHHEMAQTPVYPSRLFFFCEQPAERGGATPVCRSDELCEALAHRLPSFIRDCQDKGLRYSHVMPPVDDPSSGMGRSWRSTFGVQAPEEVEHRMRQLGYSWTWLPDGSLRATTPLLAAVRRLSSGRQSFFNQLIAAFKGWKDRRNDPAKAVTFGDGSPLDAGAVQMAIDLCDQFTVDLSWRSGDVALVDNYAAMHGRRTFEGKRSVLASLVKGESRQLATAPRS